MRLILIRHGETDSNVQRLLDTQHPGAPLNERGLQQAVDLAEAISHEHIDALYVSTLTRAQQTAEPLASKRGLVATVVEGIQEISAGIEEMKPDYTVYVDTLATWSAENMDHGIEGGETLRQFLTRFNGAVARIESEGHDNVAVVSHGAALRVWAVANDQAWDPEHAMPLSNTQWIVMTGGSGEGWRIVEWGGHVAEDA